jgi:hypothetical protein
MQDIEKDPQAGMSLKLYWQAFQPPLKPDKLQDF